MCASALSKPVDVHKSAFEQTKRDHSNLVKAGKRDPVKRAVGLTHGSSNKGTAMAPTITGYQQWQPGAGTVLGG
jgi:hypothetical protein